MSTKIKTALVEEFNDQLEELSKTEVGSEKYKIAVDGVTKLADRIIEIEKNEQDASLKEIARTDESELKAEQLADERRDRLIRNVIEGVKVVGGLGVTAWAFVASMNFEKEGRLFSTEGGRSAMRSLLKFMK